jgi:hypothetical protein
MTPVPTGGFDLSDGNCRFCVAASELLPPQFRLLFLGRAFYRDVPELGPLVDLAILLRILSDGISVRGNGCWPESPAGGIIISGRVL